MKRRREEDEKVLRKNSHGDLLPLDWNQNQIEEWLKEDIPSMDYGGFVVGNEANDLQAQEKKAQ